VNRADDLALVLEVFAVRWVGQTCARLAGAQTWAYDLDVREVGYLARVVTLIATPAPPDA